MITTQRIQEIICIVWSVIVIYTSLFGSFHPMVQSMLVFALPGLVLIFLGNPFSAKQQSYWRILDYVLIFIAICACVNVLFRYEVWMTTPLPETNLDIILSMFLLLLILDSARRTTDWIMPVLTIIALSYAYFGHLLTGEFGHREFDMTWILGNLYVTTSGYAGTVTYVIANVVAIFILAGSVIVKSGASETFKDIAIIMAGRVRGGAGLVAVIGSALFGMISGSPVANVATVGNFTIPLMKRYGFKPEFAAGVESAASAGGQILPPIMGAGAFIMAEMLGISYFKVIVAAALPAILYFAGAGFGIYAFACVNDIPKIPSEEIPKARDLLDWSKIGPLFVFVFVLMILLIMGHTAQFAGGAATLSMILLYLFSPNRSKQVYFKDRVLNIVDSLKDAGKTLAMLTSVILCVQVIVFLISLTGLGIKFSELLIALAKHYILLTVILSGVTVMILGMGVPTTAAFVIGMAVVGPSLVKIGIDPLTANLFVFYYAAISVITPPVCIAVYIAAGIAKCDWLPAGLNATMLASAAYIIPIIFVFDPSIVVHGNLVRVVISFSTMLVGIYFLAAGFMGYLINRISLWERMILIPSSILFMIIYLNVTYMIMGTLGVMTILLYNIWKKRKMLNA